MSGPTRPDPADPVAERDRMCRRVRALTGGSVAVATVAAIGLTALIGQAEAATTTTTDNSNSSTVVVTTSADAGDSSDSVPDHLLKRAKSAANACPVLALRLVPAAR